MSLSAEYLLLLFFIILFVISGGKNKYVFVLLMLVMTFMGVFRGLYVGTDHASWADDFYRINSFESSISHNFEIGYMVLILLFKNFSNDWLWFSGLTFLMPMIGTHFFIKQYKINYGWALFIFYVFGIYFTAYNAMRQYMAICSIVAFTFLLKEKRYLLFALITLTISFLLHKSTVIILLLIPIYYFSQWMDNHIRKLSLYLLIILSYLLSYVDFYFVIYPIVRILEVFGMTEDYEAYVTLGVQANTNLFSSALTLFGLCLLYFDNNRNKCAEKYVMVLFVVLYNIFNLLSTYGTRVAFPFEFYLIAYVPIVLKYLKGTRNEMLLIITTLVYGLGIFFAKYSILNISEVNPYENWLFK